MVKLVVFDIAGTTVEDPDGVGGCLKAALTAADVPWTHDDVNGIMGIPKPVAISQLIEIASGIPADPSFVSEIHEDFRARMIEFYRTSPEIKEVEGARKTFQILQGQGITVALDTGFDRQIVDVLLARLGWNEGVLDATVTSDEVANGRPHPDMIYRAMELTGVTSADDVAKVGDTPSDLLEGTAAKCRFVIGVTEGTHSEAQLLAHPHTHLVLNIREVPLILLP